MDNKIFFSILGIASFVVLFIAGVQLGKKMNPSGTPAEKISREFNKTLPKRLNKYMVLEKTTAKDNVLTYHSTISSWVPPKHRASVEDKQLVKQQMKKVICNSEIKKFLNDGMIVHFRTVKKNGELMPSSFFSIDDCY